jgi:hypothetical protein
MPAKTPDPGRNMMISILAAWAVGVTALLFLTQCAM